MYMYVCISVHTGTWDIGLNQVGLRCTNLSIHSTLDSLPTHYNWYQVVFISHINHHIYVTSYRCVYVPGCTWIGTPDGSNYGYLSGRTKEILHVMYRISLINI